MEDARESLAARRLSVLLAEYEYLSAARPLCMVDCQMALSAIGGTSSLDQTYVVPPRVADEGMSKPARRLYKRLALKLHPDKMAASGQPFANLTEIAASSEVCPLVAMAISLDVPIPPGDTAALCDAMERELGDVKKQLWYLWSHGQRDAIESLFGPRSPSVVEANTAAREGAGQPPGM